MQGAGVRSFRFTIPFLLAGCLAAVAAERPPQFIVFSYDNCTELDRWQELTAFAEEMNRDSERVHFTFFISGTNFLADRKRSLYAAPHQGAGMSRIGFGGSADDIRARIEMINLARKQGHEIGSHAVGHFDGRSWSATDWLREFATHRSLFQNIARNNELEDSASFTFPADEITGFRAPYLSTSAGLFEAQRQSKFTYDASGVGHANEWPEKKDGIWRFNLASLKIAGSGKMTLSMDYNFFVADSGAFNDPKRHPIFREQMLNTYMNYLRSNYTGNRAPVHIGHHFSPMQGNVYNQALMAFARSVCGLPEVKCVTYAKLTQFMEGLDAETLAAYRKGDFPRTTFPAMDLARAPTAGLQ
jgi:peptidoglycan/xylan/chitin deacetylase (PgdA/CDA1 family)